MGRYLDQRDRDDIHRLFHQGQTVRAIARTLCRSPSTVSREIRKHRAEYLNPPLPPPPAFDVAAARAEKPVLNRAVGQWFDTTQEQDEHLRDLAMRAIEAGLLGPGGGNVKRGRSGGRLSQVRGPVSA